MGLVLTILFWVAIVLIVIKLCIKLTTGWCRSNVCLVGKTAIVTGANTGIGYETAEDFAKRGARVILACRDPTRGNEAVKNIIKASDNKNVVFKQLDVSSFKDIRHFAEDINKTEERLDILVNNAGIVNIANPGAEGHQESRTDDGFLLLMQTNYFGPFLLTILLLDLIKKTPNSRIVNVSSYSASFASNFDVDNLNFYVEGSSHMAVYGRSKLCNILFTIELAERLRSTSTTTYSVHPGPVYTDIFNTFSPQKRFVLIPAVKLFFKSRLEGAQTNIYCSVAKGIESLSGEHFADCHIVTRYKTARDPDLPKKLWKITEELLKLNNK